MRNLILLALLVFVAVTAGAAGSAYQTRFLLQDLQQLEAVALDADLQRQVELQLLRMRYDNLASRMSQPVVVSPELDIDPTLYGEFPATDEALQLLEDILADRMDALREKYLE